MTDPEKESENQKGLSKEAWAGISAIAVALIGSIVTLITTFHKPLEPTSIPTESGSSSASTFVPEDSSPSSLQVSNAMVGKWSGIAKDPSGTSFRIDVEIHQDCRLNEKCGFISVPEVPCYGEISLQAISTNDYEFYVSNFDSRSNLSLCTPGAGEHFQVRSDGKLAYIATYSNAQGLLERISN